MSPPFFQTTTAQWRKSVHNSTQRLSKPPRDEVRTEVYPPGRRGVRRSTSGFPHQQRGELGAALRTASTQSYPFRHPLGAGQYMTKRGSNTQKELKEGHETNSIHPHRWTSFPSARKEQHPHHNKSHNRLTPSQIPLRLFFTCAS